MCDEYLIMIHRKNHLPKFPLDHVPFFSMIPWGMWGKTNQALMVQMALGITHINDKNMYVDM